MPTLWLALIAGSACGGRSMYEDSLGEDLGSDGSSGGSSENQDARLQPFEIGRSWQYRRIVLEPNQPVSCDGPFESSVTDRVTVDGQQGWVYYPTCFKGPVWMFIDGDAILAIIGGETRVPYARPPVVEGATWAAGGNLHYFWHDEGAVTVDAGTFQHCWRRGGQEDPDEYIVLCRGVGLVITNVPSGNFRLELAGKSF